ncbi:MAG: M20/M25/M40 family metallo-hydrolase [Alphaproteobacteria bacterium]
MKLLTKLFIFAAFFIPGVASADETIKSYVDDNQKVIVEDFLELLSMPNVAANLEDIYTNAGYIQGLLEKRGFSTELLTTGEDSRPAIFGEISFGAEKTVTIYIHYDGQPVDLSRWVTPPFEPVLRAGRLEDDAEIIDLEAFDGDLGEDFRIYGRSASDDKAPIIALLYALDAMKAAGVKPSVNLKLFIDGEEEAGSDDLLPTIEKYQDKLQSDYWLFFDGPQDQRGNPRVVLGVRGIIGFGLTVYGPVRGLHSGHYGNFSPNPSLRLAHLLSSMRSEEGKTLIEGFYDEVRAPGDLEKSLIAAIPEADSAIMEDAGISARENPELRYEETHLIPALNIRGLQAGGVEDKARNIIDSRAKASIGIRMVPDMTIAETKRVVEAHIEGEGYFIVRQEPTLEQRLAHPKIALVRWGEAGYPAVRTNADDPFVAKTIAIMQDITGGETLVYPILGGSLPLAHIVLPLDVPFSIVPIANQDNSQHAPNENIRLGNLFRGIEIYAALLAGLGK